MNANDLAGQRFGRLVAIEPLEERRRGLVMWRCQCDCGNTCEVAGALLRKGNTRSCGCLRREAIRRDLAGERFGRLVAVRPTEKRKAGCVVWLCKCDCGNTCEVPSSQLRSGNKRSCGCMRNGPAGRSTAADLAGERFGRLVAVRPVGRRGGYVLWECRCDCGNVKVVPTHLLRSGKTRSCGCMRAGRKPAGAGAGGAGEAGGLAGLRFGGLVARRRLGKRGKHELWECQCDCGALCEATSDALSRGAVASCGCRGEEGRSEMAGERFGKLVAVNRVGRAKGANARWRCLCDCDRVIEARAGDLHSGKVESCGHCD